LQQGYLPLGLAHQVKLKNDIAEGQRLKWSDVEYDPNNTAVRVRREMEDTFRQSANVSGTGALQKELAD
jgi:predicted homoserine dehydrogenase-like protein